VICTLLSYYCIWPLVYCCSILKSNVDFYTKAPFRILWRDEYLILISSNSMWLLIVVLYYNNINQKIEIFFFPPGLILKQNCREISGKYRRNIGILYHIWKVLGEYFLKIYACMTYILYTSAMSYIYFDDEFVTHSSARITHSTDIQTLCKAK